MVTIQTLQNGARIISEPITYSRSVSIGIWVKAGSLLEIPSEEGIAHFIEHMLFKGTSTRSAKQIAQQFDLFGGDINAFTTKEATCFYTTVLADKAEEAVTILADMLFNSLFDKEEIEKEKAVILEEIASVEDSPEENTDERLWALMYPNHPLGKPIGGTAAQVGSFTRNQLLEFKEKHYIPERLVVSIAGNFTDSLLATISSLFEVMQKNTDDNKKESFGLPTFTSGKVKMKKDIEQSHVFFGYPGLTLRDNDIYSLALLDSVLGGTMSSRLFQQVREEKGLAYSVYSYYASHDEAGALVIGSATSPDQEQALIKAIETTVNEIANLGITEEELFYAKEQMSGSYLIGLESTEARMHRNGNNELMRLKHRTEEEVISRIQEVTKEDVSEIASRLLTITPAIAISSPTN